MDMLLDCRHVADALVCKLAGGADRLCKLVLQQFPPDRLWPLLRLLCSWMWREGPPRAVRAAAEAWEESFWHRYRLFWSGPPAEGAYRAKCWWKPCRWELYFGFVFDYKRAPISYADACLANFSFVMPLIEQQNKLQQSNYFVKLWSADFLKDPGRGRRQQTIIGVFSLMPEITVFSLTNTYGKVELVKYRKCYSLTTFPVFNI